MQLLIQAVIYVKPCQWFNIKTSYQHRDSQYKNEMVVRRSYLYNVNSHTVKKTWLYWIGPSCLLKIRPLIATVQHTNNFIVITQSINILFHIFGQFFFSTIGNKDLPIFFNHTLHILHVFYNLYVAILLGWKIMHNPKIYHYFSISHVSWLSLVPYFLLIS